MEVSCSAIQAKILPEPSIIIQFFTKCCQTKPNPSQSTTIT